MIRYTLIILALCAFVTGANAELFTTDIRVRPPQAYAVFCEEHPEAGCRKPVESVQIHLTDSMMETMSEIHQRVNRSIIYRAEKNDQWTIFREGGHGDCDDYVVTYRQLLIEARLPAGALSIAMVLIGADAHSVLLVDTDQGMLVLDSRSMRIGKWDEYSRYNWVMMLRDGEWVYITKK